VYYGLFVLCLLWTSVKFIVCLKLIFLSLRIIMFDTHLYSTYFALQIGYGKSFEASWRFLFGISLEFLWISSCFVLGSCFLLSVIICLFSEIWSQLVWLCLALWIGRLSLRHVSGMGSYLMMSWLNLMSSVSLRNCLGLPLSSFLYIFLNWTLAFWFRFSLHLPDFICL